MDVLERYVRMANGYITSVVEIVIGKRVQVRHTLTRQIAIPSLVSVQNNDL